MTYYLCSQDYTMENALLPDQNYLQQIMQLYTCQGGSVKDKWKPMGFMTVKDFVPTDLVRVSIPLTLMSERALDTVLPLIEKDVELLPTLLAYPDLGNVYILNVRKTWDEAGEEALHRNNREDDDSVLFRKFEEEECNILIRSGVEMCVSGKFVSAVKQSGFTGFQFLSWQTDYINNMKLVMINNLMNRYVAY